MKSKETIFGISISILSLIVIGITLFAYNLGRLINLEYFSNPDEYNFNTDKLGQFGDFIGGFLGTVLTAIATFFIYKTYISQKNELESQRKLIAQQQFESTFFNMLNVHRELKNSLSLNSNIKICNIAKYIEKPDLDSKDDWLGNKTKEEVKTFYESVDVFSFIRLDFEVLFRIFKKINTENGSKTFSSYVIKEKIKTDLINNRDLLERSEKEIIEKIFWIIFQNYRNILSHFFRNSYHILKFIRENEIQNNLEYQKYADIFQSQLNEDEQFLLFYNFIVFEEEGKKELSTLSLCNNYKFLENLGHENLLDNELHNNKKFYKFKIK